MSGIAANIAIFYEGKILLTKREDYEVWCLPSGGVEDGESVAEAAIREAKEETGIDVELKQLVGVYSKLGEMGDIHAVLFSAKPIGGELKTQLHETIEIAYFSKENLPIDILFSHKKRIEDAFNGILGTAVKQELRSPNNESLSRKELYALRDASGLSRKDFYLQRVAMAQTNETVEVLNV